MTEDMAEWGWTEAFGEQGCSSCLRGAKGLLSQHLPSTCHPSPQRLCCHQRGRPCVGGSILSMLSSPQAHKVLRHREVQGPVAGRAASAGGCLSPSSHRQGLHPTDRGQPGSVLAGRLLEGPASTASQRAGLSHKPASFCAQEASETQPRAASQPQRPEPTASLKTENVGEGLPTLDVSRDAAESVAASEEVRATPSATAIAMGP